MSVKFTDNSDLTKKELQKALLAALEKCGLLAEGYAKKLCPVDTGGLRNSIAHAVAENRMRLACCISCCIATSDM